MQPQTKLYIWLSFILLFLVAARISLSQGTDWCVIILGIILILIACFFFYRLRITKDEKVVFENLKQAAPKIRKYLDDNRRIFINFGPNSSTASGGEVRMGMEVWEDSKQNIICPNNIEIKALLRNVQYLDEQEKPVTEKMLNHIEAFQTHCDNPNFDYSNNQFPLDFSKLIYKYCAEFRNSKNRISEYYEWLKAEIAKESISVKSIIFFGSALYGEESVDVDCIVKSKASSIDGVKSDAAKWKSVAARFERNFTIKLHLTVFSQLEEQSFNTFLSKLPAYQEVQI